MPKLWNETIEDHRRTVREAILDSTWTLVHEHGLASVTMSQVAARAGIGRATLYKYFPDIEAIVFACHEREITRHLAHLAELRDQPDDADARLRAVLAAFARISHQQRSRGAELSALLHRDERVSQAQQQLVDLIHGLLAEVAQAGHLRDDVPLAELANYCLHALTAAGSLPSTAAVDRLVTVTLAGVRPQE
ncbi:TetR/AcrR family transcriptional regulator [Lipingzhangella sp. LS1_29]|uniref:TetR/AcrR family transcriptional regulator n=1 Tax=Lipingzhangella rawalii TaxID=2055835 RepID=A0ABU2HBI8_9ACTN|nr:TetR/AcrR family transcriptional regulator [Lipingzhangella rawalii]MDS1272357.1 TetR/AcrR family transcriptional regulator [Lipingzhangella rawalii]